MKKLLLLLLLLPLAVSAQRYKKGNPCARYTNYLTNDLPRGFKGDAYTFKDEIFLTAKDFNVQAITDSVALGKLREMAKLDITCFLKSTPGKKYRAILEKDYTELNYKLYKTDDGLIFGILKAVTGNPEKFYAHTMMVMDGNIIHAYSDFAQVDYNIELFGAEFNGEYYTLHGEEEKNINSYYYGKFNYSFKPKENVATFEKYIKHKINYNRPITH
ncbi:hypothetical protein H7F15_15640 [Pontibacter sp. Tf4]|uniref:hypothetical protein n=1 Tax=Pontibacter sp. Tf4 TaxID=2761620 RepID=UPI0016292908|nr:hypothetical protein [Pontibacter sp. Tf4]MBB6612477.1 hypothetical protein [Pontibacter sp. Tf4]